MALVSSMATLHKERDETAARMSDIDAELAAGASDLKVLDQIEYARRPS
jgi:hypothetical protein